MTDNPIAEVIKAGLERGANRFFRTGGDNHRPNYRDMVCQEVLAALEAAGLTIHNVEAVDALYVKADKLANSLRSHFSYPEDMRVWRQLHRDFGQLERCIEAFDPTTYTPEQSDGTSETS